MFVWLALFRVDVQGCIGLFRVVSDHFRVVLGCSGLFRVYVLGCLGFCLGLFMVGWGCLGMFRVA